MQTDTTNKAMYTQGEWKRGTDTKSNKWMQVFVDNKAIATALPLNTKGNRQSNDFAEEEANANLIAASKDMYEALQTLLKEARQNSFALNHNLNDTKAEEMAAAALLKAEGKS